MRELNGVKRPSKSAGAPGRARHWSRLNGVAAGPHGQLGLLGAAAVAISAVDITSKAVAQSLLAETMVHTNPALSLGHAPYAPEVPLPAAGTGIAVYCLLAWWCMATERVPCWPLGAFLGGALGNFIDDLQGGGITDFIRVGSVVFNLADVAVLVGLGGACALGVAKLSGRSDGASATRPEEGRRTPIFGVRVSGRGTPPRATRTVRRRRPWRRSAAACLAAQPATHGPARDRRHCAR